MKPPLFICLFAQSIVLFVLLRIQLYTETIDFQLMIFISPFFFCWHFSLVRMRMRMHQLKEIESHDHEV